MPASTNLFVARASWPIPPYTDETPAPSFVKTEKADEKTLPKQAAIPSTLILNKHQNNSPAEEECRWGPQCPIYIKATSNIKPENTEEDWNGDRQRNRNEDHLERNYYAQIPQFSPAYDFPDRQSHHYRMKKDRNERLEFWNNLDYYSSSDSDSNSKH